MVLLTFTKYLRFNNNLVFLIDGRNTVITLNRALAGCHFGRFIIGNITLHLLWSFGLTHDPHGCGKCRFCMEQKPVRGLAVFRNLSILSKALPRVSADCAKRSARALLSALRLSSFL